MWDMPNAAGKLSQMPRHLSAELEKKPNDRERKDLCYYGASIGQQGKGTLDFGEGSVGGLQGKGGGVRALR